MAESQEAISVAPKLSTYNNLSFPAETTPAVAETPATVNEAGVITMPEVPEPAAVIDTTPTVATPTVDTPAVDTPATPVEENVSSFEMPAFEENPAAPTPTPAAEPVTNWREAIKTADRKELLKELGIEDFAIEINDHIKNGGQAADYLNAKARDWNGIADLDIVRDEFKTKFPNLSPEEIERKISRKYSLEDIDDDIKADGMIDLKSDAYELRQQRIERDKKFVIPSTKAPEVDIDAMTQQVLESQQRVHQQNLQKTIEQFNTNPATLELMQSKRVALDLGANGKFNFTVDKPEFITRAMYDSAIWNKLVNNEKGEPNVALLQELVLHAANPAKFKNDLVNYGKSSGLHGVVAEGQNAKRPTGTSAQPNDTTTYKQGTYGGMQN